MSRAFLTTMPGWTVDPLIAVEVAWGADLTDIDGSGWSWSDITDHVLLDGPQAAPISITIGRQDESSQTQTALFKCELDNRDGRYINNGLSTLWPNVRRGTPVRVRVSPDNGATWSLRFQGQAVGFTPHWDEPGRLATVTLEASGPLRVLDQGTLPAKSVYASEIPRSSGWPGMFLYWPCEGSTGSNAIYPTVPAASSPRLQLGSNFVNLPILNPSADAFPYSGPLPGSFAHATNGAFPTYTSTGSLHFRFLAGIQSLPTGDIQPLLYFNTTNLSPVNTWGIFLDDGGGLSLKGYSGGGPPSSVVRDSGGVGFSMNSTAKMIGLTLTNSGANLNYTIMTQDQSGAGGSVFSGSFTSVNIGTLTYVGPIGPNTSSTDGVPSQNVILGHISVHNSAISSLNAARPLLAGLPGESVTTRLVRVADTAGVAVDVLSAAGYIESDTSITGTCGPQFYDTLSAVLREIEVTGQGLLYDGLAAGLTYVTKQRRQQAAAASSTLTLDASSGHLVEPFGPIDDDQVLFNHVAVSQHGGTGGVEYVDQTGPEGTDAVGDHATSFVANPASGVGLIGYAEWAVNTGTVPGYRFPTVSFAIDTNPSLAASWLACTPQSRIDITNIDAVRRQLSPDPIRLLLEGWTETIDMFEWRVVANTSSAEPWNVLRLAAATGSTGDDICHMDTDSSQLNTSVSAGVTSISVRTNSGPIWVTTSGDADSFPFDITIGGIRATVTAISGASSPQTFTLSAALPRAFTGSTTPGAGAPISIWKPPVVGL